MRYDEQLSEEELLRFLAAMRKQNERLREDEAKAVGRLETVFREKRGRMEELFHMRV